MHWSKVKERQGKLGIRFLFHSYLYLGPIAFKAFRYPVILFFWLSGSEQRNASQAFLNNVTRYREKLGLQKEKLSSLKHFFSFSNSILKKFLIWSPKTCKTIQYDFADKTTEDFFRKAITDKGKLVFVSHLGTAELGRAVAEMQLGLKINALVFERHSPRVKAFLEEINKASHLNVIQVDELDIGTSAMLQEKIQSGEWVAIAADRVPLNPERRLSTVEVEFMGRYARFPTGPYILASLLKCEVIVLFVFDKGSHVEVKVETFSECINIPRKNREASLKELASSYAGILEKNAILEPYQWFNFYQFWDA